MRQGTWSISELNAARMSPAGGVRVGGCSKIPWLSSQCQNTTRGCSVRDGVGGWTGSLQRPCRSAQASMGLETMLFGVSGSWDDMDATSLPVEFEPGPCSEKLTWGRQTSGQGRLEEADHGVNCGLSLLTALTHMSWSRDSKGVLQGQQQFRD